MTTHGVQSGLAGRQQGGTERALAYLYLFRRVVVGLALVGAGAAWAAQVPWLLAACVCIAVGELLESSYYIGVPRWGQRRGLPQPPARKQARLGFEVACFGHGPPIVGGASRRIRALAEGL